MKRKYAARSSWKRMIERNYRELYMETESFTGYVTRLDMIQVTHPLHVRYSERTVQLVGDGYSWLQQFPSGKKHVVTTMFNERGKIVQTYVDICFRHGRDANGIFWDDLFLDLVLLPSGECLILDADELEAALRAGEINRAQYDEAWREVDRLREQIRTSDSVTGTLAYAHHALLSNS
ncbi:DUF402 domain-containing protein [Exiguobacterium sp. RIT452]|nr:DUF402 domain-containing protein [Exiguobacterium sp. RIT452]